MIALPDGGVGLAVKVAAGLLGAIWWTSGPGADEARYVANPSVLHQDLLHFGSGAVQQVLV